MNYKQFNNIMEMLSSPDEENQILGLNLLETQNFKEITSPLMLYYKIGLSNSKKWEQYAPKAFAYLNKIAKIKPYTRFTFKQIFNLTMASDVPFENLKFFFKEYSKYLTKECLNTNVESVEIKINLKPKANE